MLDQRARLWLLSLAWGKEGNVWEVDPPKAHETLGR